MIKLIGILIIVIGFALKLDSIGIVMISGIVTGLVGGMDITQILTTLGKTFVDNRYMSLFLIILPVVGVLERNGLKETAGKFIGKLESATPGKIAIIYTVVRGILAAFNVNFGGVAGFIRPVIYPMSVGTIENKGKKIDPKDADEIKAMDSAAENISWFFGQVLFIAGAAVLLVKGTLDSLNYEVDPLKCVKAEIPVLIIAIIVSSIYFRIIDKRIMKKYED